MTYRPRPYLPAVIGPRVSLRIVRHFGIELEHLARELARSPDPDARDDAAEIHAGIAQMVESARQWRERQAPTSVDGSAEVPSTSGGSESTRPPGSGVTTGEVAEQFGITARQVRYLVAAGRLVGHRRGRTWVIDEASVALYIEARRPA
ncbi:hypothetical protein NPS01_37790 [Nocardioides psychrotolerans]|uniref:DNA binding domain-containing protein, excisionase family n=1 Tax=Nocardioides psychrotolerans TaxID=1005945 RepID=A0A1I3I6Z7_9ACTN|nr:helix-turn-helix domain-containing protein [Nocardioides psychrotolerans]GEP40116.1 hypothetical protein NPS01_37790 [Nocardioides psychrotolerans]SFI43711.1 DNA binding domain-containing protein, excisionase family [Nocardioides psychrotolerans]